MVLIRFRMHTVCLMPSAMKSVSSKTVGYYLLPKLKLKISDNLQISQVISFRQNL